ncbi:MAG: uracil-DNA glycosylase [Burkholderiales bacterium]|jgi:DNA polymerase|nr:uracil-DNA glycosylase [Burkholderiales bacterium]
MMKRNEILEEMGLTPIWKLRRPPEKNDAGTIGDRTNDWSAVATVVVTANAQDAPRDIFAETAPRNVLVAGDERARRIAALAWEDFSKDVAACRACVLCEKRNKAVPGVGDIDARWLFVGEGPGAEEDKKGEPFVGQAGRLLDQMLKALKMTRNHDVYIANVVKCRPPGNRAPTPTEAEACRPYLERQIALIQPEIIVALGKSAASLLLNTDASIASLRGRVHCYRDVPLIVTYHPAYLLRSLTEKAKSWEDLLFARKQLTQETE